MNTPTSNIKAVFIDTETTTSKPDRQPIEVIELAWMCADTGAGFNLRYMPEHPPSWGAMAVHGITTLALEGCQPSAKARSDAPTGVEYWIGHNIDFDWRALGEPPGPKRICTLALARSLFPELDSHTLSVMYLYAEGVNERSWAAVKKAHGAAEDCYLLRTVWLMLCKAANCSPSDYAGMYELSQEARIPKTMPFGKFAGQPISAVDRGYANWYRKTPDPDPYILEAFKRARLI